MKKLALALIAILAVIVASDDAFAQGRGGGGGGGARGGGGGSGGGGAYRGPGGHPGGGHGGGWHGGGSHGGGWHGGGWHGGGWHGGGWHGGVGIYLGGPAYWGAWPYAYSYPYPYYYGAYPDYVYPYPVYTPGAGTVYVEPQQVARAPASYWYYCTDPAGYYPYVRNCNQAWMTVVPPSGPAAPNSSAPPQ